MRLFSGRLPHFILALAAAGTAWSLNIQTGYVPGFLDPQVVELRVIPQPETSSKSLILVEEKTGAILFQKNADEVIPPASLTKLVVMHLSLEHLKTTGTSLDALVTISPRAWASNAPVRSSLMFLGPDQTVTWRDLLLGLAVDSGNDAAVALAENVAGSVEAFVAMMNELCVRLGMAHTSFVEPSGYDEHSLTTTRDFARFVWFYLRAWPEAIEQYHSVAKFAWPRQEGQKEIVQYNRNRLLHSYPGADGLKTGYIDESGYNLAYTAVRDGMRLIGVILGGTGDLPRFNDAKRLLDYGFEQYRLVELPLGKPTPVRVWQGARARVSLTGAANAAAVLPASMASGLTLAFRQLTEVRAPLAADFPLAWTEYSAADGKPVLRFVQSSGEAIPRADFIVDWAEGLYLGLRSAAGAPQPEPGSAGD
jgi:D-alanyl-D-alanine carboxypeptidase (penicillin-binding protein 5/6)